MTVNWPAVLLFIAATLALSFWLEFRSIKHGRWRGRRSHNPYELRDLQEEIRKQRAKDEE